MKAKGTEIKSKIGDPQKNVYSLIVICIMILLIFLILTFSIPSRTGQAHPESFTKIIKPDRLNLVLFTDKKCVHCQPCRNAFAVLTEVNEDKHLNFVEIELNETTRPIFQDLKLTTLPIILAYNHTQRLQFEFECLGSSNKLYKQLSKWLFRLQNQIQVWNDQQNRGHQIIIDCSTTTQGFWQKIEQKQLWLDLYCGNSTFVGQNLAVIAEYGKVIQAWRVESKNDELIHKKLQFLLKAYKYKFVLNWNVAIAQQVFAGNQSAFVLLVNNESVSHEVYGYYEEIKKKWYENRQQHPKPILFAVSDLSQNTEETLRLKRYLTGITACSKGYFYPILAFIESGQHMKKYVMSYDLPKNKETVQKWIYSVYNKTMLKSNQIELEIQPFFNQDTPSKASESDDDQSSEIVSYNYVKLQSTWKELLSVSYTKPFFVYVTWRNSYELQKKQIEVVEWWKQKEESKMQFTTTLQIHLLQNIDLPVQLKVSYVPSMIYVSKEKQITKLEGVTDLAKIMSFVSKYQIE